MCLNSLQEVVGVAVAVRQVNEDYIIDLRQVVFGEHFETRLVRQVIAEGTNALCLRYCSSAELVLNNTYRVVALDKYVVETFEFIR